MKLLLTTLLLSTFHLVSFAQTSQSLDTTIYQVAEFPPYPLFKNCMPEARAGWNVDSSRRCGEIQLLNLLSSNIRYPEDARVKDIQGTVVLSFVVEPSNGRISNIALLKDIGGGCGLEAVRVLKALDSIGLHWAPALVDKKPVRFKHSIPLRFKLQAELPYYLTEKGDTIYTTYDTEPQFKAGIDSLIHFVYQRLEYPEAWVDSCKTGIFEMAVQIRSGGDISVENVLDFNNLGLDFQWEAMRLANKMGGMWEAATYQGKTVGTTFPLRVVFKSEATACAVANANFDRAMILADEGSQLLTADKPEEAIQKWSEALVLQPNNCELLYYRGTTLLNQNKKVEACKDFDRVKSILGITWFEEIRRLVCGW